MFDTRTDTLLRAATRIPPIRPMVLRTDPEAAAIMQVGEEHDFPFRVLGRAPLELVERPVFTGSWWVMRAEDDKSKIPLDIQQQVMERVNAIELAGIHPKGYVIAHEVTSLLADGKPKQAPLPWWRREVAKLTMRPWLLLGAGVGLAIIGPLVLSLLWHAFLGILGVVGAVVAVMGLGAAAAADPVLAAVTEDDLWIEVARWE